MKTIGGLAEGGNGQEGRGPVFLDKTLPEKNKRQSRKKKNTIDP